MQTANFAQGVEYFFRNAVGEIFLVALRAEIGERQNSDRPNLFVALIATLRSHV
jgi:hypothetical protein